MFTGARQITAEDLENANPLSEVDYSSILMTDPNYVENTLYAYRNDCDDPLTVAACFADNARETLIFAVPAPP